MIKRFLLIITLLFLLHSTIIACDEEQSKLYVTQILFGVQAPNYRNNDKVKMLMDALYLCSEQSDGTGKEKLDFLKQNDVQGVPSLGRINIKGDELLECSHIKWEDVYSVNPKIQNNRKKILQYTVNTVFDFGFTNELFGNVPEKSNSFAALLYYFHILADYLADDPKNTENYIGNQYISPFSGKLCIPVNGDIPTFTENEKKDKTISIINSPPDFLDRPQVAFATIGPEIKPIPKISLSGFMLPGLSHNKKYTDILDRDSTALFDRCHIIARSLGGPNKEDNLVTCTRYLNQDKEGMKGYEAQVSAAISKGLHVKYKVTPHYKGDNIIVSGIQMEAYSVEDSGKEVSFNKYCYNIQPGIKINYFTGANELSDIIFAKEETTIPFAAINPNENNPDLIYEVNKHLTILFADNTKTKKTFDELMNQIKIIADKARNITSKEKIIGDDYRQLVIKKYEYIELLKNHIHLLLKEDPVFSILYNDRY